MPNPTAVPPEVKAIIERVDSAHEKVVPSFSLITRSYGVKGSRFVPADQLDAGALTTLRDNGFIVTEHMEYDKDEDFGAGGQHLYEISEAQVNYASMERPLTGEARLQALKLLSLMKKARENPSPEGMAKLNLEQPWGSTPRGYDDLQPQFVTLRFLRLSGFKDEFIKDLEKRRIIGLLDPQDKDRVLFPKGKPEKVDELPDKYKEFLDLKNVFCSINLTALEDAAGATLYQAADVEQILKNKLSHSVSGV